MAEKSRGRGPLKVLFVGNSFTARNDLPGLIGRLAEARGKSLDHHLIQAGGASLRAHWNAGRAAEAVRDGGYDAVVLQEQSTLPAENAARMHENVRLFDGVIKAAGAKTVLLMTWARLSTPDSQRAITDAYAAIGQELGATVAPVGVAWERFLSGHATPILHDKDQSHPTVAGSYLAACVLLAALFGESPVGADVDVPGLSAADRAALQAAAWQAWESPARRTRSKRTA